MKRVTWWKGLLFGVGISIVTALIFMIIGQLMAGGLTSFWGESWLYFSVIVPFAVAFSILGSYFHRKGGISKRKLWFISFLCALFVTWYSGTIGALFGEMIVRDGGLETVNVEGTLGWGTVYAFVLLPVTIPFAKFLIWLFLTLFESESGKNGNLL